MKAGPEDSTRPAKHDSMASSSSL